jgi:murein DD-endopeptidase MepM/ murein hydrolase activator NlpD
MTEAKSGLGGYSGHGAHHESKSTKGGRMKLPRHLRIRVLSWLSVGVLSTASLLTLVYVLPYRGLAQLPADPTQISGEGVAEFRLDPEPLTGCTFVLSAADSEAPTGTFTCTMSDDAIALGIPFVALDGDVSGVDVLTGQEAQVTGTVTVSLPDGTQMEGVEFTLRVVAGGPDQGSLRIRLIGVFDGETGDARPGNENYDQRKQVLTEGSIQIDNPSPSPSPSESSSPSPTPSGSPSPTPSSSPSPSPSGTPSPLPSHSPTPPPVPTPGPSGTPPFDDAPSIPSSGASSTARMMALLSEISFDGTPELSDILSVVGPFPVAGLAWWTDDWHAYRCCPYPHLHQGLDMFASTGTPVVAAADGYVSQKVLDPLVSGLAVEITDAGGTQYFYAHLSAYAVGLAVGQRIHVGQVLGYVGNTGNASETSPHLHFEIQPGGVPEPPKPIVDQWLDLAEQRAETLVESRTGRPVANPGDDDRWQALASALQPPRAPVTEHPGLDGRSTVLVADPAAPPPSGAAMAAFASALLLALLVVPACVIGRREAARGPEAIGPTASPPPSPSTPTPGPHEG